MKTKLYTKSHNVELLKEIDNKGGRFTSVEHAFIAENENNGRFDSKEALYKHMFSVGANRFSALSFLIDFLYKNNYKNVLSMGAGDSVFEHLLQSALPQGSKVVATDYNNFVIDRVKVLLPEITAVKYDFFKDDIKDLFSSLNIDFDVVVFFASSYVMDDEEFIALFSSLRDIGVKCVIDFCGGFMDTKEYIFQLYWKIKLPLTRINLIRKLLGKPLLTDAYKGKFHGFSRSRGELIRLYRAAGFTDITELNINSEAYKYVAVLRP